MFHYMYIIHNIQDIEYKHEYNYSIDSHLHKKHKYSIHIQHMIPANKILTTHINYSTN